MHFMIELWSCNRLTFQSRFAVLTLIVVFFMIFYRSLYAFNIRGFNQACILGIEYCFYCMYFTHTGGINFSKLRLFVLLIVIF